MLVIHPKDRTTAMLSALYEGTEARVFDEGFSNSDIPQRMLALDDAHTPLTEFNYHNIHYL